MYIKAAHELTEHPINDNFLLHIHDCCEIYCFLGGNARFFVEGHVYPLHKGDVIICRSSESHHLLLDSDKSYERIVLNFFISSVAEFDVGDKIYSMFYGRPLGNYNRFSASSFPENKWQFFLDKICDAGDSKRKLVYLIALLDELSEEFNTVKNFPQTVATDQTAEIVRYLDRHLFEKINLNKVCEKFFISKTHLNRLFKTNIGTTVWNYITAKRLAYARELLLAGEHPMRIFEQCGYSDYATFYKAYKNIYGCSPALTSKNSQQNIKKP